MQPESQPQYLLKPASMPLPSKSKSKSKSKTKQQCQAQKLAPIVPSTSTLTSTFTQTNNSPKNNCHYQVQYQSKIQPNPYSHEDHSLYPTSPPSYMQMHTTASLFTTFPNDQPGFCQYPKDKDKEKEKEHKPVPVPRSLLKKSQKKIQEKGNQGNTKKQACQQENQYQNYNNTPVFTYYGIRGQGQAIRNLLQFIGVYYIDRRIQKPERSQQKSKSKQKKQESLTPKILHSLSTPSQTFSISISKPTQVPLTSHSNPIAAVPLFPLVPSLSAHSSQSSVSSPISHPQPILDNPFNSDLPTFQDQFIRISNTIAIGMYVCKKYGREDIIGGYDYRRKAKVHEIMFKYMLEMHKIVPNLLEILGAVAQKDSRAKEYMEENEQAKVHKVRNGLRKLVKQSRFMDFCLRKHKETGGFILKHEKGKQGDATIIDFYFYEICFYIVGFFQKQIRSIGKEFQGFINFAKHFQSLKIQGYKQSSIRKVVSEGKQEGRGIRLFLPLKSQKKQQQIINAWQGRKQQQIF